jgi:hypothetical protein
VERKEETNKKGEGNGMGKERSTDVCIAMPAMLTCDMIVCFKVWFIITRVM